MSSLSNIFRRRSKSGAVEKRPITPQRAPSRRLSKRKRPNDTPSPAFNEKRPTGLLSPPASSHGGDAIEIVAPSADQDSPMADAGPSSPHVAFLPKKQQRDGYQSYFVEKTQTPTLSRAISPASALSHHSQDHRPNVLRKQNRDSSESAKRRMREAESSSPTTNPTTTHIRKFSFARFGSLRRKGSKKDSGRDSAARLRPDSDMSHRMRSHKSKSSVSSSSSFVAMKIRLIDVLTPHPTIRFDHQINQFGPSLSRSNSRAANGNGDYRRELRDFNNRTSNKVYVESIADEMDARAIREAMDKDKKRREQKKEKKERGSSSKKRRQSPARPTKPPVAERSRAQRELEETLLRTRAAIASASQSDLRGQHGYLADHIPSGPPYDKDSRDSNHDGADTPWTWLRDPSTDDLRKAGRSRDAPEWREGPRMAGYGFSAAEQGHRRNVSDETYASDEAGETHQHFNTFNGAWTEYPMTEQHQNTVEQGQSALLSDSEDGDDHRQSLNMGPSGLAIGFDDHTHYRSYSSDEESRLRAGRPDDDDDHDDFGFTEDDYQHYHQQPTQQEQTHFDDYGSPALSRTSSRSSDHRVGYLAPISDDYDETYGTHSTHQFAPRFSGYHTASSVAYHPRESLDQHSGFSRPASKGHRSGAVSPDSRFGTQSLASVDSEGSWFGASKLKRDSKATGRSSFNHATSPLRTSSASITPQLSGAEGFEGRSSPGKTDSPHLGRYSSLSEQSYDEGARTRMELSDVEDEDEIAENVFDETAYNDSGLVRESAGRTPIVHHSTQRERSRVGLLREFDESGVASKHVSYHGQFGYDTGAVSPVSPISDEGDSRTQSPQTSYIPDESFRFL